MKTTIAIPVWIGGKRYDSPFVCPDDSAAYRVIQRGSSLVVLFALKTPDEKSFLDVCERIKAQRVSKLTAEDLQKSEKPTDTLDVLAGVRVQDSGWQLVDNMPYNIRYDGGAEYPYARFLVEIVNGVPQLQGTYAALTLGEVSPADQVKDLENIHALLSFLTMSKETRQEYIALRNAEAQSAALLPKEGKLQAAYQEHVTDKE